MTYWVYILTYEIYGWVLLNALKLHRDVLRRAGRRSALKHRFSASPECTLRPVPYSEVLYVHYGVRIRQRRVWMLFAGIWISALVPAIFLFDSSVSLTVAAACAFVPAGSLVSKSFIHSRNKSRIRARRSFSAEKP